MVDKKDVCENNSIENINDVNHHFVKYPNHPWLKTKQEIKEWILNNIPKTSPNMTYTINDDLTVDFNNPLVQIVKDIKYIPIQIRSCDTFSSDSSELSSLIGTPIDCNYVILRNGKVESLEGLSGSVKTRVYLNINTFNSFYGMPDFRDGDVSLFVRIRNLENWNGFTKIKKLNIFDEIEDEHIYKLLLKTPKCIESIRTNNSFKVVKIKKSKDESSIDMDWLRLEQKLIESKKMNKKIDSNLLEGGYLTKKRKV